MPLPKQNLHPNENPQPSQGQDMAASRFLALAQESADIFWLLTPKGEMEEASSNWQTFTGQAENVALGRGWLDALHPADQPHITEALNQSITSRHTAELECHIRRYDDSYRLMYLRIIPVYSANEGIYEVVVCGKDITQEDLTRQMSAAQMQLAIKAAGVGIWDWDIITNQLTCTDQCRELFGFPLEASLTYDDFKATIHPADRERVTEVISRALDEKTEYTTEFRIALPDGSTRWAAERGQSIYDAQGKPIHMVGATIDITALKEVEQQKDLFLGMTSHELKTPLAALKGTFQLMQRRIKRLRASSGELSPEINKFCEGLTQNLADSVHQINIQTRLINDLLDISRITLNTLKLSLQECDLAAIVRKAVKNLQVAAPERSLLLNIPEPIIVNVLADPDRITQVVTNYVNNALCYSSSDQPIYIGLSVEADTARVWVQDRGPGLSEEARRRVWDLFYQDKSVLVQSGSSKGMGLGLYICQMLITQHQGKVGVTSEQGKGSTFWFTLPIVSEKTNQTATEPPPAG